MSSDSEESSHTSAHNGEDAERGAAAIAPESPIASRDTEDGYHITKAEEEDEQEELVSLDGGTNALTFARHRNAQKEYDEESSSDVAIRPTTAIPGSPGSISTPDDTPSIQVGHRIL